MENQQLPWEKPRIKRVLELFKGSRVMNIKRMSSVTKEVGNNEFRRQC